MQRLIFLIDGISILLFLWLVANIVHVIVNKQLGGKFFWLANKIKERK